MPKHLFKGKSREELDLVIATTIESLIELIRCLPDDVYELEEDFDYLRESDGEYILNSEDEIIPSEYHLYISLKLPESVQDPEGFNV